MCSRFSTSAMNRSNTIFLICVKVGNISKVLQVLKSIAFLPCVIYALHLCPIYKIKICKQIASLVNYSKITLTEDNRQFFGCKD